MSEPVVELEPVVATMPMTVKSFPPMSRVSPTALLALFAYEASSTTTSLPASVDVKVRPFVISVLVSGPQSIQQVDGFQVAVLTARGAWEGITGSAPGGTYAQLEENGLTCLVTPCAHITETIVNRRVVTAIAEVDYGPSGADANEIAAAVAEMSSPAGVIVAGDRYTVTGAGGSAPARTATEIYFRIR